jgi:hypothetical protein
LFIKIGKALPKNANAEIRKRMTSIDLKNSQAKKSKVNPIQNQPTTSIKPTLESVIDEFVPKLNVQENVADLVMVTMAFLPEQVPPGFLSAYKPISDAGSLQQKRNLSKMIAILLNEAGLLSFSNVTPNNEPNSVKDLKTINIDDFDNDDEDNDDNEMNDQVKSSKMINQIKSEKKEVHEKSENNSETAKKFSRQQSTPLTPLAIRPPANLQSLVPKKEITKTFKLSDVTSNSNSQFNLQSLEELLYKTYTRILGSERMFSIFILLQ